MGGVPDRCRRSRQGIVTRVLWPIKASKYVTWLYGWPSTSFARRFGDGRASTGPTQPPRSPPNGVARWCRSGRPAVAFDTFVRHDRRIQTNRSPGRRADATPPNWQPPPAISIVSQMPCPSGRWKPRLVGPDLPRKAVHDTLYDTCRDRVIPGDPMTGSGSLLRWLPLDDVHRSYS